MEDMKWDMGGAGAVAGAMLAIARRKAKANVVAVCGLVENMPDGNAQRFTAVVGTARRVLKNGKNLVKINIDKNNGNWAVKVDWGIIKLASATGAQISTAHTMGFRGKARALSAADKWVEGIQNNSGLQGY